MWSVQLLELILRRIFYRFWIFYRSACIFAGNFISAVYNAPTFPCMPASYGLHFLRIPTGPIRLRKSIRGCAVIEGGSLIRNTPDMSVKFLNTVYNVVIQHLMVPLQWISEPAAGNLSDPKKSGKKTYFLRRIFWERMRASSVVFSNVSRFSRS